MREKLSEPFYAVGHKVVCAGWSIRRMNAAFLFPSFLIYAVGFLLVELGWFIEGNHAEFYAASDEDVRKEFQLGGYE